MGTAISRCEQLGPMVGDFRRFAFPQDRHVPDHGLQPQITSGPALDGQVLRVTGYFPTSPEQVQFELAYQHTGDQWLLAGIAISVAPPTDNARRPALHGQLLQASGRRRGSRQTGGETDPHRFEFAGRGSTPTAPKKPAAVKGRSRPAQKTAASQAATPAAEAPAPPRARCAAGRPAGGSNGSGPAWNPFGR